MRDNECIVTALRLDDKDNITKRVEGLRLEAEDGTRKDPPD